MSSKNSKVTPQAGQGNPLPKKELDQFRNLVKNYEIKQYKKALKAADVILKKFENHGETLAMKGLVLNAMPGKDKAEAKNLVKLGLRNDMRSYVCWHVYGLLHRAERNYNEAIKAYKQALRIDVDNLQILRDLSLLQIQMRDLKGFSVTRQTILGLKPNQKINWLSFALAKHLIGDQQGAVNVLKTYLDSLGPDALEKSRCYETSELLMYLNSVLNEIPGNEKEVLNHLNEIKPLVVDHMSWSYSKGVTLLLMGEFNDASKEFRELLENGSIENYRIHAAFMCAVLKLDKTTCGKALKLKGTDTVATMMPLYEEHKALLIRLYQKEFGVKFPKSYAVPRILLTILEGDSLRDALDVYCRKDIVKGAPFLATDIAALFMKQVADNDGTVSLERVRDPTEIKSNTLFKLALSLANDYIESLTASNSTFPDSSTEEPPSTLLWAWYFKARLLEFSGNLSEALSLIDTCMDHTPTCVDIYECKGRLLKLSGDIEAAADCLDKGRELDKQDRYINNKTTKYLLRANRDDVALERISLFTRHEGNPLQNLYDMQCIWYELEAASCYERQRKWGPSLKKYAAIEKHFEDINEDQFDFHSYCIRKVTLRAYTNVLRFEDDLWGQNSYRKAAEGMIRIYLYLSDNPEEATKKNDEVDYSKMNAAERKKAKAIARKKKKKAAEKAANTKKEGDEKAKANGKVDVNEDPNGEALLALDHLKEAKKYVSTLVKNCPKSLSTWMCQYDVAVRREKYLMAAQALFKAKAINCNDPELFTRTVDFCLRVTKRIPNESLAEKVLSYELASLTDDLSLSDYVLRAAARIHENCSYSELPMRVVVAKALIDVEIESITNATAYIIEGGICAPKASLENCREALKFLSELGVDAAEAARSWTEIVKQRYPLAKHI